MEYAMLYKCLTEARARAESPDFPQDVRDRSKETVALLETRMANEGLTLRDLKRLAGVK